MEVAIGKLLKQGYIEQVYKILFCCSLLMVAGDKKLRIVLDLQHVNAYLHDLKFRYEDLKTLENIFEKGFLFCHVGPQKWSSSYQNSQ